MDEAFTNVNLPMSLSLSYNLTDKDVANVISIATYYILTKDFTWKEPSQ